MEQKAPLCLALLALLGAAGTATATPVEKVVTLLTELKDRIIRDGKEEQMIYDKYACWCEKTSRAKAVAIELAQMELRDLGQQILTTKGTIAVLTAEIAELKQKIKENEEKQAELTSIRQAENKAYQAETTELMQAIAALEKAIIVLYKGTFGDKEAALVQDTSAAGAALREQAVAGVRTAIRSMPTSGGLSPEQERKVSAFLEASSRAGASYAPQSETVQGILKDMYDTFTDDLESKTLEEANKNRQYEDVMAVMQQEVIDMKATLEKKEKLLAEAEETLANTQQSYDDTEKQMNADIAFFDQTKEACEAKFAEWTQRKSDREMELKGIAEALKILTSDEARELFARSIKPGLSQSFLQIGESDSSPAMKAFRVLKQEATRTHSLRLAQLAATVKLAKYGHFDKVIKAIDEMIEVLKAEEADDIKKRDDCKTEYQDIASTTADLKWKIEKNMAKIDKLEKLIKMREDEKTATLEQIDMVLKQIADMEEQRKEENQVFLGAKSDDEGAIQLLEAAKAALMKYYEKNKIEMGPIQGSTKLLQEPEFEISAEQAPDATFSDKGSRKNESKGIISILTMIIEDLYGEIKVGMKSEEETQLEFEKSLAAAKKLQEELEEKVKNLNEIIATRNSELESEHADMKENNKALDDKLAWEKEIKPDCDWMLNAFAERKEKRAAEMNGLVTAKEYLAGAAPPELLQQVKHFDDAAFPKINFRGLSFLQRK